MSYSIIVNTGAPNTCAILSVVEMQTNRLKSYLDEKFENAVKNRLWSNLEELFKSIICHETAKPAIKFGGCCGSVLEPLWYGTCSGTRITKTAQNVVLFMQSQTF